MLLHSSPEATENASEADAIQDSINRKIRAWRNGFFEEANDLRVILSDKKFYDRFSLSWENEEGKVISLDGYTLRVDTPFSRVEFVDSQNEITATVSCHDLPEILVSEKV